MGEGDLQQEYGIAMELLKSGEYADALVLLNGIAEERPNSKHVMYSRALCLVALGRVGEARLLRDELARQKGSGAREFTAKLDVKLREKLGELEKAAHKGLKRTASSVSSMSEARVSRSVVALIVVLIVVAAIVGAVVFHIRQQSAGFNPAGFMGNDSETPFTGTGPDPYVEVVTFYPLGKETHSRFAVFFSPPEGEAPKASTDNKEDCVGAPAVSDWQNVKAKAMKALAMSRNDDETLGGVPRHDLVCTVAIPRAGMPLSGKLAEKDIVTFTSGDAKDLASAVKACGEPMHKETWTREGACLGLSGETCWWGRVGLAADASGEISHVLVRAYPGDRR
jgi:hypothetical protein